MHQFHIKSYFYLDIKYRMNEYPGKEEWYCDAWPRVELHREQHPRRSLHWAITCDQETFVCVYIEFCLSTGLSWRSLRPSMNSRTNQLHVIHLFNHQHTNERGVALNA